MRGTTAAATTVTPRGTAYELRQDGPAYTPRGGRTHRLWVAYLIDGTQPIEPDVLRWKKRPRNLIDEENQVIDLAGGMDEGQPELWTPYRYTEAYREASWKLEQGQEV